MKRTILLLLAVSLLLCLCACAEKKTESTAPAATFEEPTIDPNRDKTPVSDLHNEIRDPAPEEQDADEEVEPLPSVTIEPIGDAETLPTLTWPEIPDPEPVEPDTESADS